VADLVADPGLLRAERRGAPSTSQSGTAPHAARPTHARQTRAAPRRQGELYRTRATVSVSLSNNHGSSRPSRSAGCVPQPGGIPASAAAACQSGRRRAPSPVDVIPAVPRPENWPGGRVGSRCRARHDSLRDAEPETRHVRSTYMPIMGLLARRTGVLPRRAERDGAPLTTWPDGAVLDSSPAHATDRGLAISPSRWKLHCAKAASEIPPPNGLRRPTRIDAVAHAVHLAVPTS
jgi:hypothetical protein